MKKFSSLKHQWRYHEQYDNDDAGRENYSSVKENWKREGTNFLKKLTRDLHLKKAIVDFNAGGVAVSGDLTLRAMITDSTGVYVHVNLDGCCSPDDMYYRSIKHLRDYTGGCNHWLSLDDSYEHIRGTLFRFLETLQGVSAS